MATKRRLINKKAYEELLLLQKLARGKNDHQYFVSIQVDENGNEGFVIEHYIGMKWIARIVGENYTVVSKMLIDYLNK